MLHEASRSNSDNLGKDVLNARIVQKSWSHFSGVLMNKTGCRRVGNGLGCFKLGWLLRLLWSMDPTYTWPILLIRFEMLTEPWITKIAHVVLVGWGTTDDRKLDWVMLMSWRASMLNYPNMTWLVFRSEMSSWTLNCAVSCLGCSGKSTARLHAQIVPFCCSAGKGRVV